MNQGQGNDQVRLVIAPFSISLQKPAWKYQNENASGKESGRVQYIVGHGPWYELSTISRLMEFTYPCSKMAFRAISFFPLIFRRCIFILERILEYQVC